jgi:hypothetical protein
VIEQDNLHCLGAGRKDAEVDAFRRHAASDLIYQDWQGLLLRGDSLADPKFAGPENSM